jgi:hypothetical protein
VLQPRSFDIPFLSSGHYHRLSCHVVFLKTFSKSLAYIFSVTVVSECLSRAVTCRTG